MHNICNAASPTPGLPIVVKGRSTPIEKSASPTYDPAIKEGDTHVPDTGKPYEHIRITKKLVSLCRLAWSRCCSTPRSEIHSTQTRPDYQRNSDKTAHCGFTGAPDLGIPQFAVIIASGTSGWYTFEVAHARYPEYCTKGFYPHLCQKGYMDRPLRHTVRPFPIPSNL